MRRPFLLLTIVAMSAVAPAVTRTSALADADLPELSPAPTSSRFT